MNFIRNLRLKNKLRIPIIFQFLLIAIFVVFYFYINSLMQAHRDTKALAMDTSTQMRSLFYNVADFVEGKGKYEELNKQFNDFMKRVRDSQYFEDKTKIDELDGLTPKFKVINDSFEDNAAVEKQVMELTDLSIRQSNSFLTDVSRKLADSNLRRSVSNLERLVIAGATVNTDTNYKIKVLFLQLKDDPARGPEMVAFLDQALQNVNEDEKRLANTPYIGLVQKAKEANGKIKNHVTQFIQNAKKINDTKQEILNIYESSYQYINGVEAEKNLAIFKSIRNIFIILIIVVVGITLFFLLLGITLNRYISHPIFTMTERAYDLAVGEVDMTKRIPLDSSDEIGELGKWFNKFLERLQELIVKVKNGSDEIHRATDEITQGSEDLAHRTNEQAASITETSTTVEQFTTSVRQNTENSAEADMMLTSFNQEIQEKKVLIENVNSTMTEIFDSSKQIDNIVKVINDISFQTNLLALNAAVEAARAGEAGRGFAVVAAEVRNLAQKTAESSKSIQGIVGRNVESTQKGVKLVKDTSEFFGEVVEMMGETVEKISNITNASREQTTGIDQINNTIGHMDEISSRNAALVEELSATGKKVLSSVVELQELVASFKVDETSAIKGSDYAAEVLSNGKKKKKDKKTGPKKEEKKPRPKVVKEAKKEPEPPAKPTPTEDDFFGEDDDGFEEF